MSEPTRTISVCLPLHVMAVLRAESERSGESMSSIAAHAIRNGLQDREHAQLPATFTGARKLNALDFEPLAPIVLTRLVVRDEHWR